MFVFPLPSQVNLCLISMERLHYLIRIWFYCRSIMSSLLITFNVASAMVCSDFRRCTSRILVRTRQTDCAFSHLCRSFSYHGYFRNPTQHSFSTLWLNPQGQKACSNNFHSYWSFCCNHSPICHLLFSTSCRLRTISQFFNQATLNYSNSYNKMAYGPQDTFYLIVLPSLLQSNPKKVEHLYWREEFQEKIIICECLSNYSAVNDIL